MTQLNKGGFKPRAPDLERILRAIPAGHARAARLRHRGYPVAKSGRGSPELSVKCAIVPALVAFKTLQPSVDQRCNL